jgi:hypothetical protein
LFSGELNDGSDGWIGTPRTEKEISTLCENFTRTVEEVGGKVNPITRLTFDLLSSSLRRLVFFSKPGQTTPGHPCYSGYPHQMFPSRQRYAEPSLAMSTAESPLLLGYSHGV